MLAAQRLILRPNVKVFRRNVLLPQQRSISGPGGLLISYAIAAALPVFLLSNIKPWNKYIQAWRAKHLSSKTALLSAYRVVHEKEASNAIVSHGQKIAPALHNAWLKNQQKAAELFPAFAPASDQQQPQYRAYQYLWTAIAPSLAALHNQAMEVRNVWRIATSTYVDESHELQATDHVSSILDSTTHSLLQPWTVVQYFQDLAMLDFSNQTIVVTAYAISGFLSAICGMAMSRVIISRSSLSHTLRACLYGCFLIVAVPFPALVWMSSGVAVLFLEFEINKRRGVAWLF